MNERFNETMNAIRNHPNMAKAIDWLEKNQDDTLKDQLELCALRAPSNMEETRAKRFYEMMCQAGLDQVTMDQVHNVIGIRRGTGNGPTLVIAGHMDTVFGPEIDCTPVKKDDGFIWAPGICDDTRGMAEVLALAKAVCACDLRAEGDLLFVGNVGEESTGDLRGSRHLFDTVKNIGAFLSIDGPTPDVLIHEAIAGYKYRFTFTGRGGHALGAFGIPNVNNAIGYAAGRIAAMEVPETPKTIFNIGVINGGVSVNAIPSRAEMMVDLRSMSMEELEKMRAEVLSAVRDACEKENARWNHPTERIALEIELLSQRPGGTQSPDAPIVQAACAAYEQFGLRPELREASTDSNIPISRGIPAVTIGRGGLQIDGHTVNERFDPTGAYVGPQRALLLLFALAGLPDVAAPIIQKP